MRKFAFYLKANIVVACHRHISLLTTFVSPHLVWSVSMVNIENPRLASSGSDENSLRYLVS